MQQLELELDTAFARSPDLESERVREPSALDIEHFLLQLNRRLKGRLGDLQLTDNRSTILTSAPLDGRSSKRRPSGDEDPAGADSIALRIHRAFVFAPAPVLDAVASFAGRALAKPRRRAALGVIRAYFDQTTGGSRKEREVHLQPQGCCYDLARICDELNRQFFDGELEVQITWGRRLSTDRRRCRQHSIQLGSYVEEERLIRLHRILDRPEVPRYVVESVAHHELLHAAMPAVGHGRRRLSHPAEFRLRERLFPRLDEAEQWIKRHLFAVLKRRS